MRRESRALNEGLAAVLVLAHERSLGGVDALVTNHVGLAGERLAAVLPIARVGTIGVCWVRIAQDRRVGRIIGFVLLVVLVLTISLGLDRRCGS